MKQYWLTVEIEPHPTHPVSHSDKVYLRAYFDENPPKPDPDKTVRKGVRVPTEKSSPRPLTPAGSDVFCFPLTAKEFTADSFLLYLWVEPYGAAALQFDGRYANKAVGRMELELKDVVKGEPIEMLPNMRKGDEEMRLKSPLKLADSVLTWTANFMNESSVSSRTKKMKEQSLTQQRIADELDELNSIKPEGVRETIGYYSIGLLANLGLNTLDRAAWLDKTGTMGRAGHPDDEIKQYGKRWDDLSPGQKRNVAFARSLDAILAGGGDWDLKPRIDEVWGTMNRLGNAEYCIPNDFFSNIHFGYVAGASGFKDEEALWVADLPLHNDPPEDKDVTVLGMRFWDQKKGAPVTWQDLIRLVLQVPQLWIYR